MSLENNTIVMLSSIDQMPNEILVAIFKFIPPNEVAQICVNVSIKWKELITSCILQPILRNLSLCSHEIKQKLISMGWSDDNNELQSADKNDPDLILSLIEIFEKASLQLISSLHGRFIWIAFDEKGKDCEIATSEKNLIIFLSWMC